MSSRSASQGRRAQGRTTQEVTSTFKAEDAAIRRQLAGEVPTNFRFGSLEVPYSCDIEIRYGEVDMQGIVFNAHYLAYVDHCIDRWLRSLDVLGPDSEWDIMVKKATIDWIGSAGIGDVLTLVPLVSRWGNTSFDITVDGAVGERPVFRADIVYVGVRTGTKEPARPPDHVKAAMSG